MSHMMSHPFDLFYHFIFHENKIQKIRDDAIFNIGESGKVTANEIIRIINEKV